MSEVVQHIDTKQKKKPVIVLTGPTAVGKTALSIGLARELQGSVISADSMQVYKKMDIGSAKIRQEEMQGIPHYLVDVLDPKDDFNVYIFQKMAKEAMEDIWARNRIPIITGGTGFYIQAVLKDVDFTEEDGPSEIRKKYENYAAEHGADELHRLLQMKDPAAAEEIHPNNVKRVIRALEFQDQTGLRISDHNIEQRQRTSPYNVSYFVLNDDRQRLYERINQRVDLMIQDGLVEEVRSLMEEGLTENHVSMKGLGYKELFPYLRGECSLDDAIEVIKRDTRHFAKRQLTWFRREEDVIWINKNEFAYDESKILKYMCEVYHDRTAASNV